MAILMERETEFVERRAPRPPRAKVRGRRRQQRRPWWRVAVSALLWTVVVTGAAAYAASLAVPLWFQVQGQRLLIVTSGSMAPTFVAGDVVVLKAITDESQLKVDQVVTFRPVDSQALVTHRVVALHRLPAMVEGPGGRAIPRLDSAGNEIMQPYIITQGDANPSPDPDATPVSRVRGVVLGWHHGWGRVLLWTGSSHGRATMLVPPLAALVLLELIAVAEGRRTRPHRRPRPREEERLDALLLD